jgi:hypothetical protein
MAMSEAELRVFFRDDPAALARALERLAGSARRPRRAGGREPLRAGPPPGGSVRVTLPRHRWPAVHDALLGHRSAFTTAATANGVLVLHVSGAGERTLRRLGLRGSVPAGRDPWPDPERPLGAREGVATWAKGPSRDDPLEAAFRAYQRRVGVRCERR